jgi:predicted Ser/Thr protein kinase
MDALGHKVEQAILVLVGPVDGGKVAVRPVPRPLAAEAVDIAHPNLKCTSILIKI